MDALDIAVSGVPLHGAVHPWTESGAEDTFLGPGKPRQAVGVPPRCLVARAAIRDENARDRGWTPACFKLKSTQATSSYPRAAPDHAVPRRKG